jgi:hypothetical protein
MGLPYRKTWIVDGGEKELAVLGIYGHLLVVKASSIYELSTEFSLWLMTVAPVGGRY